MNEQLNTYLNVFLLRQKNAEVEGSPHTQDNMQILNWHQTQVLFIVWFQALWIDV